LKTLLFALLLIPTICHATDKVQIVPNGTIGANGVAITNQKLELSSVSVFQLISSGSIKLNGSDVSSTSSTQTWTAAQAFTNLVTVSSTVHVSGTVRASTVSIKGASLFISSFVATQYDGFSLCITSGAIAANTSLTINTASFPGIVLFGTPFCVEHEDVNTSGTSVRVKSITADLTSFVVFNADAINAKKFGCFSPCRR